MRTYTPRMLVALVAAFGMAAALLATVQVTTAPSAQALVTWTSLESGTTQRITGVDYKSGKIAHVTAGGELAIGPATGPFAKTVAPSGPIFTDVVLNPAGTRALAVGAGGDDGELYVYDGSTWAQPDLSTATVADPGTFNRCQSAPASPALAVGPVTNVVFHDAAWASDTVGYVVGTRKNGSTGHAGYALKTTDGGATWTDMQNRADSTCMLTTSAQQNALKHVHTTSNPDWVWLHGNHSNTNALYRSTNGLASASQTSAKSFLFGPMAAIDPNNTQRLASARPATGYTNWLYSDTMWSDSMYVGYRKGHDDSKAIRDLEASPNGWFFIAGDGGLIERTKNGTHAEALPAAGALRFQDWKSIAFANERQAVVAGESGALAITSTANQPVGAVAPARDITAPVVKVTKPKKKKAKSAKAWKKVKGTITDVGSGPKNVKVKLVQKKGKKWTSFNGKKKWKKAKNKKQALKKAKALTDKTVTTGKFSIKVKKKPAKKGKLIVQYWGADAAGNTAKKKTVSQKITKK